MFQPSKQQKSHSAEAKEKREKHNKLPYDVGKVVCRISRVQAERAKNKRNRITREMLCMVEEALKTFNMSPVTNTDKRNNKQIEAVLFTEGPSFCSTLLLYGPKINWDIVGLSQYDTIKMSNTGG